MPPSVASGIDCLTICRRVVAGGNAWNIISINLPFLKSIGWYPVTKESESYNDSTHYVSGYDYEVREDDVLESIVLAERQPEPQEEFSTLKYRFVEELRNKRLVYFFMTQ